MCTDEIPENANTYITCRGLFIVVTYMYVQYYHFSIVIFSKFHMRERTAVFQIYMIFKLI